MICEQKLRFRVFSLLRLAVISAAQVEETEHHSTYTFLSFLSLRTRWVTEASLTPSQPSIYGFTY